MARSELLAFFIIACVLAVSLQQAYALKCWTCSSYKRGVRNAFCDEPFDESKVSQEDREVSYKECPNFSNQITSCRKLTQEVNNNLVYARSCHSRPSNVGNEVCYDAGEPPSFVKNKACELCNTDGCNGVKNTTNDTPSNLSTNGPSNVPTNAPSTTSTNAPADNKGASSDATHFSPLALFVVIPVAVARSFLLQ